MARGMLRVAVGKRRDAQAGDRLRFRMDDAGDADGLGKAPYLSQQFICLRAIAVGSRVELGWEPDATRLFADG